MSAKLKSKIVEVEGEQIDLEELIGETKRLHPKNKQLDKDGREILSPVPLAPPVGYRPEPSIFDRVRSLVRSEHLRLAAQSGGYETFEEADDFAVDDDYDPRSPYEVNFDPPPLPAGAAPPPKAGAAPGGQPLPAGERTPTPAPASPAAPPPAQPPKAP